MEQKKDNVSKAKLKISSILSELTPLEAIEVIKELSIYVGDSEVTCRDFIFDMPARSKLRNKEVFDFIMSLPLRHMQQIEVVNACVDKFGKELSPSRTGLNRYWKKLRVLKSLE
jgi:hypothetical protein